MTKLPEIKIFDITLQEIDKHLENKKFLEKDRIYLGMSQIGEECWRKLFYSFRKVKKTKIPAKNIRAIEDGYLQESVMAERLRFLLYIELYTEDPKNPGNQIGFDLLLGHFRGHCDGIIKGIKEAPRTWHVWEHKSVNEKKFNKLKKIREDLLNEKKVLKEWDIIYYVQAQIYMHCSQLERHYLTVTTPGGRDYVSIRTNYNKKDAESIIEKAKIIIFDNWHIPAKISQKREFYKCKWCDYQEICHDGVFPDINCKTCRYLEPIKDGKNKCLFLDEIIDENKLFHNKCKNHLYNPALINAKLIEQQEDCCVYETEEKIKFANCILTGIPELKNSLDAIYTSDELKNKIKNINNLSEKAIKVQKEFNGEIIENIKSKKKWDKKLIF